MIYIEIGKKNIYIILRCYNYEKYFNLDIIRNTYI